jgi:DNA polymerase
MLLTKMIEACTFSRSDVYILNTIKCRPPGNRNPTPTEIANCREYFEQQLEMIRPQYIVCLGLVAAQTLLGSTLSIGRMRGRFHAYHDSKVLATYHPAYLLRNPDAKKEAWADLKMLMQDMGIEVKR